MLTVKGLLAIGCAVVPQWLAAITPLCISGACPFRRHASRTHWFTDLFASKNAGDILLHPVASAILLIEQQS